MDRVAAALQREGIAPQEVISICAGTSLEYAAVFLGALRAGVAVAPLAPSCTAEELAGMAADAGAKLFFLDAAVANALEPVAGRIAAKRIALDASPAGEPFPAWLAPAGAKPAPVEIRRVGLQYHLFLRHHRQPEGNRAVACNALGHIQRAAIYEYDTSAVTMIATPLYSNTTLVCFFPPGHGGAAVLMAKFDAVAYSRSRENHRATHTMLVPVQYQRIMALPGFDSHDLPVTGANLHQRAVRRGVEADVVKRWPGASSEFLRHDRRRRHSASSPRTCILRSCTPSARPQRGTTSA